MGMSTHGEVNGRLVPDGEGDPIPLLKRRLRLGGSVSCDITFRCPSVPPQFCKLTWDSGHWRVRSIADPPALVVNGRQTTEMSLSPSDVIHIGHLRYTIDWRR